MGEIPFTEYILPNGRKRPGSFNRPDEIYKKAIKILEAGYHFECEMLTTGEVSLTVGDKDGDYNIKVVKNGPEVLEAVDQLVEEFHFCPRCDAANPQRLKMDGCKFHDCPEQGHVELQTLKP